MENTHNLKISQANGTPEPKINIAEKVVIDLEALSRSGNPHPEYDPGVVIHYLLNVEGIKYEVNKPIQSGLDILVLTGKDPKRFRIVQIINQNGKVISRSIDADEKVDLRTFGIEKFLTEPVPVTFFIDKKAYYTIEPCLSVRQILVEHAKVDPELKTLAVKKGGVFIQYEKLDEIICLEQNARFTLFDNTPTTIS